jgi:sensor histidine kinase YesM
MQKNTIYRYLILILVGSLSLCALLIILLDFADSQRKFSLAIFLGNMLVSIPYTMLITIIDYKLVMYINNSKWFSSRLVTRIIFEAFILVVLAILFVIVGNIPFRLYDLGDIHRFINSIDFYISALLATLLNVFIVTILEYLVQIKKNDSLKNENLHMQYLQLKSQINPHFLFNSLNVLTSLINKDSQKAVNYIQKFSKVYRYVLSQDTKDLVYVNDEVEFINIYIEILRIRYGEALRCEIDIDECDLDLQIPPMSLQLLIENAVKHNAITSDNPLTITIRSSGDYLLIYNNIVARTRVEESTGIGLKNLQQKYNIISQQSIEIENKNLQFTVKLPLL